MKKVVCNIPFAVTKSNDGDVRTIVGDPAAAARWLLQCHPELEIVCCFSWDITTNKSQFLVRNREAK